MQQCYSSFRRNILVLFSVFSSCSLNFQSCFFKLTFIINGVFGYFSDPWYLISNSRLKQLKYRVYAPQSPNMAQNQNMQPFGRRNKHKPTFFLRNENCIISVEDFCFLSSFSAFSEYYKTLQHNQTTKQCLFIFLIYQCSTSQCIREIRQPLSLYPCCSETNKNTLIIKYS